MWILLSLAALLAVNAAELTVELAAPWRASRHLETAAFLFNQHPRNDFWNFVSKQNALKLNQYEPFLSLALQSGEYVPYVEAHAQLAQALQSALGISPKSHNWAVFDHNDDGSVHVLDGGEEDSQQCNTASKLEVFESTDFILPSQQHEQRQLVCVLFGDFETVDFYQLFASVKLRFANTHRIVLRMNPPPADGEEDAKLGGFSVSLDIKNTEYVQTAQANDNESKESGIDFAKLVERFPAKQDSLNHLKSTLKRNREKLNPWEIADISIQFALHVLQHGANNASKALQEIKLLSENLPSFVRQLAEIPVTEQVQNIVKLQSGQARSQLFINNHVVDSSHMALHSLVRLVQQEEELISLQQRVAGAKPSDFAQWTQRSSFGERVDVRKFAKGAVLFLNDIEKDAMYRGMPTSVVQQFKLTQQQQLVQVRRNLYTAILTIDASVAEQREMLQVVRHFVRMGAPIRFGLVFYASSSPCSQRVAKLVFAAKKEYGMDAALQFVQSVRGVCEEEEEELMEVFASALAKHTKSWTKSKFIALAHQALQNEQQEDERANRYVQELGLPVPSLTFNGQLVKLSGRTIDRVLQEALFSEQDFIRTHVDEVDESRDILQQLLGITKAKPKLSKFRNQTKYVDSTPVGEYTAVGKAPVRVTVWLPPTAATALQQGIVERNPDVRVATTWSDETSVVVNGRLVMHGAEQFNLEDLQELVDLERDRLASVPTDKSADELLVCSLAMHKMTTTQDSSASVTVVPAISPLDDFSIVDEAYEEESWRVLTLVVNPLDANTAKLAAMAVWLKSALWPTAKVQIQLAPEVDVAQLPPASFHRWSAADTKVTFDTTLVPAGQVLTLKMQANANWIVFPNLDRGRDPDNLILRDEEQQYTASYKVGHVLVDGHAFLSNSNGEPAAGMQLELVPRTGLLLPRSENPPTGDSIVMYNLGYWQIKAKPGFFTVRPKPTANKFTGQAVQVDLHTFAGPGAVQLAAQPSSSSDAAAAEVTDDDDDGTMHVFSLASGALYERFLRIMMLSVRKRSTGKVKFWLLENYMSKEMKQFLPGFASANNFTYELVTFKWPEWLRGQSERQRQIWGMKILFLDVLFPLNLKRVIYVDADQVLRSDLRELWNMDLHGAPYAMTPFCDSRKETLGFQFWRQGFWAQHLRGKPYHISALFVVDLVVFRRDSVGDRLRAIYQQLSSDPGSLSNLDQDLPNFAQQHDIPIFSLPQEWLWCESWCSDDSLNRAKTIDLCNNPLRKEPKLDMAKRVIRGDKFQESWEQLDKEVGWEEEL